MVALLLAAGCDPDQGYQWNSPLCYSMLKYYQYRDQVQPKLMTDAYVQKRNWVNALIVNLLMSHEKTNLNKATNDEQIQLFIAMRFDDKPAIQKLVGFGANIDEFFDWGETLLTKATL